MCPLFMYFLSWYVGNVCSKLVSIGCGQMTSENITYILGGDEFMDSDASCQYQVCRCSNDVCRIKLEFNVGISVLLKSYQTKMC